MMRSANKLSFNKYDWYIILIIGSLAFGKIGGAFQAIVLLVVSAFISYYVLCNIPTPITGSLSKFFWNFMMTLFVNTTVTVVLFLLFKCEINTFFRRITAIIKLRF